MNEKTSKRVAAIAGKILAVRGPRSLVLFSRGRNSEIAVIPWSDIRALAASCLNQAPDKTKKRVAR